MSLVLLGILNSQAAAAGGQAAFELLQTTTLTSTTSSITFSGLNTGDYKHLKLLGTSRSASVTNITDVKMRINSATSNYSNPQFLAANGSTVYSYYDGNFDYIYAGVSCGAGQTSGIYGAIEIDINDAFSTNKYPTMQAKGGVRGSGFSRLNYTMQALESTSAVSQIELFMATGESFSAYTTFSIYGVR